MWLTKLLGKLTAGGKATTTTAEVISFFDNVQAKRKPIQIEINHKGRSQYFTTYLLQVRPKAKGKVLQFDELLPKEGNALLRKEKYFMGLISDEGVDTSFEIQVSEVFNDTYLAALPKALSATQQRSNKRVSLSDLGVYAVEILSDNRSPIKGVLKDVSVSGLKVEISLKKPILPPLQEREILYGFHLSLAKSESVQLEVEIKRLQHSRSKSLVELGATIRGFHSDKHELLFNSWLKSIQRRTV